MESLSAGSHVSVVAPPTVCSILMRKYSQSPMSRGLVYSNVCVPVAVTARSSTFAREALSWPIQRESVVAPSPTAVTSTDRRKSLPCALSMTWLL